MTQKTLSYAVDDQDHLIRADSGFYAFAEENGWHEAGDCLGRVLWDFVAGHEMQKLQRMLLRRIRQEARSVELPFRCDGPEVRREMDIQITAHPSRRVVLFSARLRSEETRETIQPMLDPSTPRSEEMLGMCGWCDRFEVDGKWVEIEEAALRLGLFQRSELPSISHGICHACNRLLLAA